MRCGTVIGVCIGLILSSSVQLADDPARWSTTMSFYPSHFRQLIVRPSLHELGLYSPAAEELLLGTAAKESVFGTYLKQLGGGPALGVYQMEPATFYWLQDKWGEKYPILAFKSPEHMIWDLKLATKAARLRYLVVKEPLPEAQDIVGLGKYWKQYYNTEAGAGTVEEFVESYNKLVKGKP